MRFKIGNDWIGSDEPTYFIADLAANHDGDIDRAKHLIELAKKAGAQAAKFQNFKAPKIVSKKGFEKIKIAHQEKWEKSVYSVYEDASLRDDWTPILREHCNKIGITYFTSPYDIESVDHADPFVPAYKIGSGDITFHRILKHIAAKNKPILLATGASTLEDVIKAVEIIKSSAQADTPLALLQCNTNYTGQLENFQYVNLNVLKTFRAIFPNIVLGLSDHTPGHATVLGAVALGAKIIEKHFTDDNKRQGPDHAFSMTPTTWREMVDRTRELELALGDGVKRIEFNEKDSAVVQRRGIYLNGNVKKGENIREEDIEELRPAPAGIILPFESQYLIGRPSPRDFQAGEALTWKDFL